MRRSRANVPVPVDPHAADNRYLNGQDQLLARVAWMYYVEGRNQENIGVALKLNRMRINRLLLEARERGIVQIALDPNIRPLAELEARLCDRYQLRRALVCPRADNEANTLLRMGHQLGNWLNTCLEDGMTIGTHRGESCHALFQGLKPTQFPNTTVVTIQGNLTPTGQFLPQEVAARLALTLSASCYYLPTPTYAASIAESELLHGLPLVQSVLQRALSCDLAIFSPGTLSLSRQRILKHLLADHDVAALQEMGAIGTLLGRAYDRNGNRIRHEVNDRCIGLDPDRLATLKESIMIGHTGAKLDIMHVALVRRMVTTLVTDEPTALALLKK